MVITWSWNVFFPLFCRMASRVLLATMAVPIPVSLSETEKHLEYDENVREKSRRLANLLGLQSIPTRASLVNEMVRNKTTHLSFSLDLGYLPFTVHGKTGNSSWKIKWFALFHLGFFRKHEQCNNIFLLFLVCSTVLDSILWQVLLPRQILQFNVYAQDFHLGGLCKW